MATRTIPWAALGCILSAVLLGPAAPLPAVETQPVEPLGNDENLTKDVTQGALRIVKEGGEVVECPLKHTAVEAEVSGFIARVRVTQVFFNPLKEKIEAVYVFPLPHKAAVDDMTMVIGDRQIVGVIKRRAEARRIYEEALAAGATAALLEQERPNIFTQSVGNIKPGQEVRIEISYVDVLEYDLGVYQFHFPMVVGPRYIPGGAVSKIPPVPEELKGKVGELDKTKVEEGPKDPTGTGWSPDTDRVPDASRITPPVLKPGMRTGHDVSLSVWVDAGVPIRDIEVPNHKADVVRADESELTVTLLDADSIPNKDFVLRYAVVGDKPEMAVLTHTDPLGGGYFMLMVQPREDERLKQMPPRELVFLVDVSGSMSGGPIAKCIEAMQGMLRRCKEADTFQVIKFAGSAQKLFEAPVPCTAENLKAAGEFVGAMRAGGGTEMLKGVKMTLDEPPDPKRIRIVVMLTDGYIGNEAEIIAEVGRRAGDRVRFWCIGIGQAPNRFLVDGVARQGGGMGKDLGLNDPAEPLVEEIMFRIHRAQLADVTINWGMLRVSETYPARIPELWAGRPIVLFGRYEPGESEITISGRAEGEPVSWRLPVRLPLEEPKHDVLAKVWARNKIEELMHTTYYAGSPEVEEAVTEIALEYRLMSQYTSFVAVDESEIGKMVEPARPPRRMLVPVPIPEGTRYEGFFGDVGEPVVLAGDALFAPAAPTPMAVTQAKSGRVASGGFGYSHGFIAADAKMAPSAGRILSAVRRPVTRSPAGPVRLSRSFAEMAWSAGSMQMEEDYVGPGRNALWARAMQEEAAQMAQAAEARPTVAVEPGNEDALLAERAGRMDDYLRATALAQMGHGTGDTSAIEARLEEINKGLVRLWTGKVPALAKRLDLVLRDVSMKEALDRVASAAGLKNSLVPGSLDDAAAVTQQRELRVVYLDLRGATADEALDWLLVPERLSWWIADSEVRVASARRGPTPAPWVYDVSLLVMPEQANLDKVEDYQKRAKMMKQSADAFLGAVSKALGLERKPKKGDAAAAKPTALWYGPGQLLLFADAATHEAAAKLFADLADPKATLEGDLADLHKTTSARAEARKDANEKILARSAMNRTAEALAQYSWRLLAAAAGGKTDEEALANLEVAWRSPATAELLKDRSRILVIRSAWALNTARALAGKAFEADVPQTVRDAVNEAAKAALADLEKSPDDPAAYFTVLYAALGVRDPASEFLAKAKPLLTEGKADSPLAAARTVAKALLAEPKDADAKALADLVAKGVQGDDLVVLTALACRRAGGEAWTTFRAESQSLLGNQPLSGAVVVLVNRLAGPEVKLASAE